MPYFWKIVFIYSYKYLFKMSNYTQLISSKLSSGTWYWLTEAWVDRYRGAVASLSCADRTYGCFLIGRSLRSRYCVLKIQKQAGQSGIVSWWNIHAGSGSRDENVTRGTLIPCALIANSVFTDFANKRRQHTTVYQWTETPDCVQHTRLSHTSSLPTGHTGEKNDNSGKLTQKFCFWCLGCFCVDFCDTRA